MEMNGLPESPTHGLGGTGETLSAMYSLAGTNAVVTGGARGIGSEVAHALADCGAQVFVVDLTRGDGSNDGGRINHLVADVSSAASVAAAFGEIRRQSDTIDILVNCAAVIDHTPALEYESAAFRRILDINVLGTFNCCQAAAQVMSEHGGGRIVNFASVAGMVGYANAVAYIASKGAVVQLTKALAIEWAPLGIAVNAVAPGTTLTAMLEEQQEKDPVFYSEFVKRIPLKRFARPSEIVGGVVYLCSPASSFVTGHILVIDGGYTVQ